MIQRRDLTAESPPSRFGGDDDDDDDAEYEDSWIEWFCGLEGHEFLAEVEEDYVRDRFNLFGLKACVPNFEKALVTILSEGPQQDDLPESEYTDLYRDARDLYGLIHARYITSPRGLALMKDKFMRGTFGQCPRVLCDRQNSLPVGITDQLDEYNVRLYCPKCQETYEVARKSSTSQAADGGYFGPSFPHVFLQSYPNLVPIDTPVAYIPRIFGFRVSQKKSVVQVKLELGEFGESLARSLSRRVGAASLPSSSASAIGSQEDDSKQTGNKITKSSNNNSTTREPQLSGLVTRNFLRSSDVSMPQRKQANALIQPSRVHT